MSTLAGMLAWRIGDFRFGGTTIVVAGFLAVLLGAIVLAVAWATHRLGS